MRGTRIGVAGIVLALACVAAPATAVATATTLTVNSTLDPGDGNCATNGCTLREAMTQLDDGDNDADRITIAFSSLFQRTITLASDLPTIDEPLEIAGGGLVAPIISGGGAARRPFTITAGSGVHVRLSGLQLTASTAGAVFNNGPSDLTITDSTISGNAFDYGGGVYSGGGNVTIVRSTVADNDASGAGGGVYSGGPLRLERSTISGNRSFGFGGGVMAASASVTVVDSTIAGNSATKAGGGLAVASAAATVSDSTVAGNAVDGPSSHGGGIYASSSYPELTNTIVADNTSTGGGPDLDGTSSQYRLSYTLVEHPAGVNAIDVVPGSNLFEVDPQLGPLAANGGPTFTHLPASTSPVIDKGSAAEVTDQRLVTRPQDHHDVANASGPDADGADIGAVELPAPPPPGPTPTPEPTPTPVPGAAPPAPSPTAGASTPAGPALQTFGPRARVTLTLASRRVPARGPVRVVVRNRNGFAVTGRLTARTIKRRPALTTAARSFRVGARARTTVALRLTPALRALLRRSGRLALRLRADVRDPSGRVLAVTATATPRIARSRR